MDTRVDRISATDLARVEYLEPLTPADDWFARAAKRAYPQFHADVVAAIVDGAVLS